MGHEIDLKRYDIRTDLVIDTIDNNDDNIDTLNKLSYMFETIFIKNTIF